MASSYIKRETSLIQFKSNSLHFLPRPPSSITPKSYQKTTLSPQKTTVTNQRKTNKNEKSSLTSCRIFLNFKTCFLKYKISWSIPFLNDLSYNIKSSDESPLLLCCRFWCCWFMEELLEEIVRFVAKLSFDFGLSEPTPPPPPPLLNCCCWRRDLLSSLVARAGKWDLKREKETINQNYKLAVKLYSVAFHVL